MSPVDRISDARDIVRAPGTAAPGRLAPTPPRTPAIGIDPVVPEYTRAEKGQVPGYRRSLEGVLFSFIQPDGWAGTLDPAILDSLAGLARSLDRAGAAGDDLAAWSALIIRHELGKHELLRDYLNSASTDR
jgi:hypothetical protein